MNEDKWYGVMFEQLKVFNKILVTGPQRSGTTICSKMIAVDTGHKFLSQAWLEGNDPIKALQDICNSENNFVIQCPGESVVIERFSSDDVLIVFMMRDVDDIIASQVAHNWDDKGAKSLYQAENDPRPIAVIKYERWEKQKKMIKNWLEVEYSSLSNHRLFVPKSKRVNWHIRQIDAENVFLSEVMFRR